MKLAHKLTRADMADGLSTKPYAYYFRLHLLSAHAELRIKRTGMARAFEIIEPRRVWA